MAVLINSDGARDLEQGLVEQRIEVLEIDYGKREPIIAEHNSAAVHLERFSLVMVIISIIFIFMVMWALTDSDKERAPIAFTVLRVASFSSILIGIVIGFGRALHAAKIGPALPIKRILVIGNVLLCISEGFFVTSVFAAFYLLVPFQSRWHAIYVCLVVLVAQGAILAFLYGMLELRAGFAGTAALISIALIFRLSGLYVVLVFSRTS